MQSKSLQELTDDELSAEFKTRKTNFYWSCGFVGFMFGVATYATFNNGFGILTLLPIFVSPVTVPTQKKYKEAKTEMAARNLK